MEFHGANRTLETVDRASRLDGLYRGHSGISPYLFAVDTPKVTDDKFPCPICSQTLTVKLTRRGTDLAAVTQAQFDQGRPAL